MALVDDNPKAPRSVSADAGELIAKFRAVCGDNDIHIVAIASGFAYCIDAYGDVILTLPRNEDRFPEISKMVKARSRRGRFEAIIGQKYILRLVQKAVKPDTLMTWEEYLIKFPNDGLNYYARRIAEETTEERICNN